MHHDAQGRSLEGMVAAMKRRLQKTNGRAGNVRRLAYKAAEVEAYWDWIMHDARVRGRLP